MGAGDVKLLAVTGFYMGLGIIFTDIFLSILIAALYSGLLLIRKKIKMKEEISFAAVCACRDGIDNGIGNVGRER